MEADISDEEASTTDPLIPSEGANCNSIQIQDILIRVIATCAIHTSMQVLNGSFCNTCRKIEVSNISKAN